MDIGFISHIAVRLGLRSWVKLPGVSSVVSHLAASASLAVVAPTSFAHGEVVLSPAPVVATVTAEATTLQTVNVAAVGSDLAVASPTLGGVFVLSPAPVAADYAVTPPIIKLMDVLDISPVEVPISLPAAISLQTANISPVAGDLAAAAPTLAAAIEAAPEPVSAAWWAISPSTTPEAVAGSLAIAAPTMVAGAVSLAPDPVSFSAAVAAPTALAVNAIAPPPAVASAAVVGPSVSVGEATLAPAVIVSSLHAISAELAVAQNSKKVVQIQFPATGNHYFVDNQHPSGSDSNPGTERLPWLTLSKAMATAVAGDTVWVKEGTYAGGTFTSITGPIALRAFPTHVPRLNNGSGLGYGIRLNTSTDVIIDGFRIDDVNQGLYFSTCTGLVVENCIIHDTRQQAVTFIDSSTDGIVRDCYIHHIARVSGLNGEGVYIGNSVTAYPPVDLTGRITVQNCLIHDTNDEAVDVKHASFECIIEGNHCYRSFRGGCIIFNGGGGYPQSNPNHICRNNVLHDNVAGNAFAVGVSILSNAGGIQIYNNVCYDNEDFGIRIDDKNGTRFPVFLYHNTCFNSVTRGIHFEDNPDYTATNNLSTFETAEPGNLDPVSAHFVDAANKDFRLAAGQAPVDAGTNVGILLDILDVSRDANPDMGAYEHES